MRWIKDGAVERPTHFAERGGCPTKKGNPGRPKGAQNRTTRLIAALLDGEAEAIGRKCIERAKEGDPVVLRLAMDE